MKGSKIENKRKRYQGMDLQKESHLDNSDANEGHIEDRVTCCRCHKKLPNGDYGQKDKFGNRFCNLKCLKAFHGIPEVHD